MGAVGAEDVLGPDNPDLPTALASGTRQRHDDGVIGVLVDFEPAELQAVVRCEPGGRLSHHLGEVVQHPRLVDDQVRELADAGRVVGGARDADDA